MPSRKRVMHRARKASGRSGSFFGKTTVRGQWAGRKSYATPKQRKRR